ncbi:MAG: flavodoxin family protein [Oscillospiraceae bacterium]|nr:flavodoxin family protein [Oscillospiraceae bacterium]
MSDILCMFYSRTGNTEETMKEIAAALEAELVEITDDVDRSGLRGFLRSGKEAMRRSTHPLEKFQTEKNLEDYRLVILGSPVWAGRCSSPIRALLKRRGLEMKRVAYVLTRASERHYEEIYDQMDQYTAQKHVLAVSLRPKSVGYAFWRDKFIQDVKRYLEQ